MAGFCSCSDELTCSVMGVSYFKFMLYKKFSKWFIVRKMYTI